MATDITTQVLIEIRDEIRATKEDLRGELRAVSDRLDVTNARLDATNERLDAVARRQVETEIRLATELVAVREAVDKVATLYREDRALQHDVTDLKVRVSALERKAG